MFTGALYLQMAKNTGKVCTWTVVYGLIHLTNFNLNIAAEL